MRKMALAFLVVVCCLSFIGSACAATLQKGDTVYARSNLREEGNKILWHNMRALRGLIPVGTEIKIKSSSGSVISCTTPDNKTHYVYDDSNLWEKYFVKDRKEIGLDALSSDTKKSVENGEVVAGMTKEEVYASKGCPAYIAWGKTTERSSFNEIMKSDKWYYMTTTRGHDVMATFANGVVVKTGGFEK